MRPKQQNEGASEHADMTRSNELESARAMVVNLELLEPMTSLGYYDTETEPPSATNPQ
jgi:hypothetical protein